MVLSNWYDSVVDNNFIFSLKFVSQSIIPCKKLTVKYMRNAKIQFRHKII